jgi:putative membrane protein
LTLRWLLAAVHLLALGVGLGAVWARAAALRGPLDAVALRRVFAADGWWGVAALLWVSTGLWRLLAGTEKATAYYMRNPVFWTKMALFAGVLALELWPMVTLIRWRRRVAAGGVPDTRAGWRLAGISYAEAGLVVLMVLAATAMARGYGLRSG